MDNPLTLLSSGPYSSATITSLINDAAGHAHSLDSTIRFAPLDGRGTHLFLCSLITPETIIPARHLGHYLEFSEGRKARKPSLDK